MAMIEEKMSKNFLFYKRHVDDIFCIFQTEYDADSFLENINTLSQDIKFTVEKESNKSLNFLRFNDS